MNSTEVERLFFVFEQTLSKMATPQRLHRAMFNATSVIMSVKTLQKQSFCLKKGMARVLKYTLKMKGYELQ
jgi:hypothetical protein